MDYEKKYKEALERAKKGECLESIFPELKNSKIREEIIKHLISFNNGCYKKPSEDIIDNWVAWLEKQGEQKPQDKPALEVWKDMRLEVYQQASGNRHEPNYSDDSTKMFSLTDIDEIFEKVAEKQCEYKPDDKVKKKFKVGDIVRHKNGDTVTITGINEKNHCYYYKAYDGAATVHSDFSFGEECNWELDTTWLEKPDYTPKALEVTNTINEKPIEEYNVPDTPIKDSEEVTSRMKYIDENLKPIAEFVIDYANWNLKKDEWNHPVATVPLFRVLDALVQKGKQYSEGCSVVDNNTEPKFKVGDWVVENITNGIFVGKITSINTCFYGVDGLDGNWYHIDFFEEEQMHLWTIQDAKDGDILIQDSIPFIFKCWANNCIAYCGITDYGLFKVVEDYFSWCNGINVTPATKEQRDLLFSKMKEAGYEWNAEKKEMKKIEQMPQTELPKGEDYAIDGLWQAIQILEHSLGEVDGWQSDDGILEHRCAIEAVKRLYEQKSAWGEEDEKMKNKIIKTLTSMGTLNLERYYQMNLDEVKGWFESLKDRV